MPVGVLQRYRRKAICEDEIDANREIAGQRNDMTKIGPSLIVLAFILFSFGAIGQPSKDVSPGAPLAPPSYAQASGPPRTATQENDSVLKLQNALHDEAKDF